MLATQSVLALLLGSTFAVPFVTRDDNPKLAQILAQANVTNYVAPNLNRDITDWLAIGDSFSAGITADYKDDELNWWCSRYSMSYPSQINGNPRFPGPSTSRTFVFGSCSGGAMVDVLANQLTLGDPDLKANYPKIGKPQIGTLTMAGNDLRFGDIVNACLYHWLEWVIGQMSCGELLKEAHTKLDDPSRAFEYDIIRAIAYILGEIRKANPSFQLYIVGYVEFWNELDTQCDTVSWASGSKPAYLTTTLRADMNAIVRKLNDAIKEAVKILTPLGGIYYVDGWQSKFDGHRFCEHEDDPDYHHHPINPKTWFIHYETPWSYRNPFDAGKNSTSIFDQIDSMLIPPKGGKSTTDQIKLVNGHRAKINPAYQDKASMNAALKKLAQEHPDRPEYLTLPNSWMRVMHPKGFGYTAISDAVIDNVLLYGATGASASSIMPSPTPSLAPSPAPAPAPAPAPKSEKICGFSNNKFMARDDMNNQIGIFCTDAAKQGVQDKDTGSIFRKYNGGTRYEVDLRMDWPPGLDITTGMEANCKNYMAQLMDGCDGNDPKNPLNWKHGGTFQTDQVKYNIIPQTDQNYSPGTCSFHLQEDEKWIGVDGPSTARTFTYHIEKDTLRDGAGIVIATMGFDRNGQDGVEIEASDKNPLVFNSALPSPVVMTPESGGHPRDYIQFNFGGQAWSTHETAGMSYCNVGGWTSNYSPANRNMDCFFSC